MTSPLDGGWEQLLCQCVTLRQASRQDLHLTIHMKLITLRPACLCLKLFPMEDEDDTVRNAPARRSSGVSWQV